MDNRDGQRQVSPRGVAIWMRRIPVLAIGVGALLLGGFGLPTPGNGILLAYAPALAAGQPVSPFTATMYSNIVDWHAPPGTHISATLSSDVRLEAVAEAKADDRGRVELTLRGVGKRGSPPTDPLVRPGYRLMLRAEDVEVESVVPDFAADVSPDGSLVSVRAPDGQAVTLTVEYSSGQRWTTPTIGGFPNVVGVELPATMERQDHGQATAEPLAGHKYVARFQPFYAVTRLLRDQAVLQATPGSRVELKVAASDGQTRRDLDIEVKLSRHWDGEGISVPGVVPGDTITVTNTSHVDSQQSMDTATIPSLDVAIVRSTNTVAGNAPPDAPVEITLTSPEGQSFVRDVTAGADGAFSLSAQEIGDLGPGWVVEVHHQWSRNLGIANMDLVPQLEVWVGTIQIRGRVRPDRHVTVTLLSASEEMLISRVTSGTSDGRFYVDLTRVDESGYSVDYLAEPGMILELDDGLGDSLVARVPDLAVWSDPDLERVEGIASPGARLIALTPTSSVRYTDTLTADGAGEFAIDYAGRLDIEAPQYGTVTQLGDDGHQYVAIWAPIEVDVEIGRAQVTGYGPPGRQVHVALLGSDGAELARSTMNTYTSANAASQWSARPEDRIGQAVHVRGGDTIYVEAGDEHVEVLVPGLQGVVHLDDQVLAGSGPPNADVVLDIRRSGHPADQVTVTMGTDGLFSYALPEPRLAFNDHILARLKIGRHGFSRELVVPGLELDLFPTALEGSTEPLKAVTVTRLRGGLEQVLGATVSSETGLFRLALEESGHIQATLIPGDEVIARADTDTIDPELRLGVPELVLRPDIERDAVAGSATPGGRLRISVRDIIRRFEDWTSRSRWVLPEFAVEAPGTFDVTSTEAYDVRPAQYVSARYRLPSGHQVSDEEATPFLQVQDGGSNVCGTGRRGAVVEVEAQSEDGIVMGQAEAIVARNGWYSTRVLDGSGSEVVLQEGVTVVATLDGVAHEVKIQPLSVSIDWDEGEINGQGPRSSEFTIEYPVRTCIGEIADPGADWWTLVGETRADGSFYHPISSWDRSETFGGIQVGIWTPDGHRFYRQIARSVSFTHVGGSVLEGVATPLTVASAVLRDADGTEAGHAEGIVDSDGNFTLNLIDRSGAPVIISAGQSVEMVASGETVVIDVEQLSFDFNPATGLVGRATPGQEVTVVIYRPGFGPLRVEIRADDDGRFAIRPEDLSPRSNWTFADIERIRLERLAPGLRRHYLVVDLEIEAEETASIFLPWAQSAR